MFYFFGKYFFSASTSSLSPCNRKISFTVATYIQTKYTLFQPSLFSGKYYFSYAKNYELTASKSYLRLHLDQRFREVDHFACFLHSIDR